MAIVSQHCYKVFPEKLSILGPFPHIPRIQQFCPTVLLNTQADVLQRPNSSYLYFGILDKEAVRLTGKQTVGQNVSWTLTE